MSFYRQLLDGFHKTRNFPYRTDADRQEAMLLEMEHILLMILEELIRNEEEKGMKPLFVSYRGSQDGKLSLGWVVLTNHSPIVSPEDMTALVNYLESERKYDAGSLIINSFQRLEDAV